MKKFLLVLVFVLTLIPEALAQRWPRGGSWGRGYSAEPRDVGRGEIPFWPADKEVPRDCFTFARLRYRSWTQRSSWRWDTDYRDSDLNMSYRLHQFTSMPVDPEGTYVEITDKRLFNYPFLFMSGVGGLELDEEEAEILRRYMLTGGFIMVDDFHGHAQWDNFYRAIKMVFPDREPVDVPLEHPIFHTVYDLKEKYQIPNYRIAEQRTWEESDWKEVHYCAIFDDKGRIMCFIDHNSDVGDGWEEEKNNPFYFENFSEPKAFPIGINVIVYAMTH